MVCVSLCQRVQLSCGFWWIKWILVASHQRPSGSAEEAPSYLGCFRWEWCRGSFQVVLSALAHCKALSAGGGGAGGSSLSGPLIAVSWLPFCEGPLTLRNPPWFWIKLHGIYQQPSVRKEGLLPLEQEKDGSPLGTSGSQQPEALQLVCSRFAPHWAKLDLTPCYLTLGAGQAGRSPAHTHLIALIEE